MGSELATSYADLLDEGGRSGSATAVFEVVVGVTRVTPVALRADSPTASVPAIIVWREWLKSTKERSALPEVAAAT